MEDAVSKWQFLLRASDSGNESIVETLDITVQQHKAHRSANHDISIGVKLIDKFRSNVDWQIRLIKGSRFFAISERNHEIISIRSQALLTPYTIHQALVLWYEKFVTAFKI